jgi:hypothetical protein
LNRTIRGQLLRSMPSKFLYETELISGFEHTPAPELDNGYSRFAPGGAGAGRVYGKKDESSGYMNPYGRLNRSRSSKQKVNSDSSVRKISRVSSLSSASSVSKPPAGNLAKGDKVRHPKMGDGVIREYLNLGANSVITVGFDGGQTKTFIEKNAGLEKIG